MLLCAHDEEIEEMPLVVVKSEPKCKFCSSPYRDKIDEELALRSKLKGAPDEDGVKHDQDYILDYFAKLGVENPNMDNVRSHWGNEKKHSYFSHDAKVVHTEAIAAATREQLEMVKKLLPEWPDKAPTPEQLLELQRALFPFELMQKIRDGKPLGITWDQLDRGLNTATRRKSDEQAAGLIASLAGAIEESARTAGKAIDAAIGEKDELPIIDAEIVEPLQIEKGSDDE